MKGSGEMAKKLSEEAKKAQRDYQREWQRKNKDKVRGYIMNYWEKKAREVRESERKERGE